MKYILIFISCVVLLTTLWANDTIRSDSVSSSENALKQEAETSEESFDNPFAEEGGISAPEQTEGAAEAIKPTDKKEKKPPFWYKYNFGKKYVTTLQKKLNIKVSNLVYELKANMTFTKALVFFFVCLFYAILHTGGPGHGKLILGTYFLTDDQKRKKSDAVVAGIIVSLTHNGMAVVLSGLLYLFIRSFGDQRQMQEVAKQIGGVFVIITGIIIMLTTVLRGKVTLIASKIFPFLNAERLKKYPLYIIAVLSGIVPCPLAWTVLVLGITTGLYWLGLIGVFGMALGAGITVGTTGLIILTGKDKLFSFVSKEKAENFAHILRFCGGLFLVFFGYLMTQIVT
jgi:ABC-type nickel/cobalt efflux system permease component RcnA